MHRAIIHRWNRTKPFRFSYNIDQIGAASTKKKGSFFDDGPDTEMEAPKIGTF